MLKNVRGPITENVLTCACGKMPGGFADIAGTTARTQKLIFLQKNLFPVHLVENTINHYLTLTRQDCNPPASVSETPRTFYFKLPYIGPFSIIAQKKVRHFAKRYCNNIDIKLVFSSFKIGNLFSVKDPIPRGLRAGVVYKPFIFNGKNLHLIINFIMLI